ncbi:MAG: hypothetical protein HY901_09215 [Deltaproteobacteria bacterium]|nr:hypothetical protein [Deltaproteobacteria bacterium]
MARHPRRHDRGEFKIGSLIWLSLLGAIGYFGAMYGPVYNEQWELKSMLQDIANSSWVTFDMQKTHAAIVERAKKFDQDDQDTFALADEDIVIVNDQNAKTLSLEITWTRNIKYPFLDKWTSRRFTKRWEMSTQPNKY